MSKLETGDFFHVKNATAKDRDTKYCVVVDPVKKIFFFINSRKDGGFYESYAEYDEEWNLNIIINYARKARMRQTGLAASPAWLAHIYLYMYNSWQGAKLPPEG